MKRSISTLPTKMAAITLEISSTGSKGPGTQKSGRIRKWDEKRKCWLGGLVVKCKISNCF